MPQASRVASSRQRVTASAPAAAVAAAGRRQHHRRSGRWRADACGAADRTSEVNRRAVGTPPVAQRARAPRTSSPRGRITGDVARRALLQEQLGGLHHRLAVEALAHAAVEQHVGERDERHALVVRHVGADHRDARALGEARARVVERLVEAVRAPAARARELDEVARRRGGIDHRRQRRRVRRDHQVLAEPALEPEPGHAEARVLVGEVEVAHVVRGLGDAPRDAAGLSRRRSGAGRRGGTSARAGCRRAPASPAPASGTRTSSPTTRRSAMPVSTGVIGRAEAEPVRRPARRPWRSRRSSPAAPPRRAGRSALVEGRHRRLDSRWRRAGGARRTGTRSPCPSKSSRAVRSTSSRRLSRWSAARADSLERGDRRRGAALIGRVRVSLRPLGQLTGRGARELGQVAEPRRRLYETTRRQPASRRSAGRASRPVRRAPSTHGASASRSR